MRRSLLIIDANVLIDFCRTDPTVLALVNAFDDWVCLLTAEEQRWTCVTNDRRLRGECAAVGVQVMWGLQLLSALVDVQALPEEDAIEAGWAIHRTNPRFIPAQLVEKFVASVRKPNVRS